MAEQGLWPELWEPGPRIRAPEKGGLGTSVRAQDPDGRWIVGEGKPLIPPQPPGLLHTGGKAQVEASPRTGGYMGVRGCGANTAKLRGPRIGGPGSGLSQETLYVSLSLSLWEVSVFSWLFWRWGSLKVSKGL